MISFEPDYPPESLFGIRHGLMIVNSMAPFMLERDPERSDGGELSVMLSPLFQRLNPFRTAADHCPGSDPDSMMGLFEP